MKQPNRPDMSDQEALVARRFELSMTVPETFFENESGRIAEVCWAMARRFSQGGRLLAFGNGAQATDAQHVSVEFVHPVIVGKRALPALALTNDSATMSGMMAKGDTDKLFVHQMRVLARPQDIAMGFTFGWERCQCPGRIKPGQADGFAFSLPDRRRWWTFKEDRNRLCFCHPVARPICHSGDA